MCPFPKRRKKFRGKRARMENLHSGELKMGQERSKKVHLAAAGKSFPILKTEEKGSQERGSRWKRKRGEMKKPPPRSGNSFSKKRRSLLREKRNPRGKEKNLEKTQQRRPEEAAI